MSLGFAERVTEMSTRKNFGVKRDRRVSMTTSPLLAYCLDSVGLDISQPYGPPWPVMGDNFIFTYFS
jgi:hypothetical protein